MLPIDLNLGSAFQVTLCLSPQHSRVSPQAEVCKGPPSHDSFRLIYHYKIFRDHSSRLITCSLIN